MTRKKSGLDYLYFGYAAFLIIAIYLILHPFIWICLQVPSWKPMAHRLTQLWAWVYFPLIGQKLSIQWKQPLDPKGTYVFVANHFSYYDVAVGMGVVPHYFAYVGKSSVKKIPLLGYMFRKLHIQVDRSEKNSRSTSLRRAMQAVASGRSVFIMPEGGIVSDQIPQMKTPLKDGAFLVAIDQQVPIVPISFLNLHEIMPENFLFYGKPKILVHAPVSTIGLTRENLSELKEQVYHLIQDTLNQYETRSRHH